MTRVTQRNTSVRTFYGLNRGAVITEGEFSDMQDLTAAEYPAAATRPARTPVLFRDEDYNVRIPMTPGLIADMCLCDGDLVFASANGLLQRAGQTLDLKGTIRQIVPFNGGIFVSPCGYWVDNEMVEHYGRDDFDIEVTAALCDADGQARTVVSDDEAPASPANGDFWFDTTNNGLYVYSEQEGKWIPEAVSYISLSSASSTFKELAAGDAIEIQAQIGSLNSSFVITWVSDDKDCIVIPGLFRAGEDLSNEITITVKKRLPVMDYVCEHQNRIFGCRYGENDKGEFVNEIYASALGDPLNFFIFEGLESDSYMAGVGAAGAWTGIISLEDQVIFYKEDCYYILTGTGPASYSLTHVSAHGVEAGSYKSLTVVGGYVFYKSNHGIQAMKPYSLPACVSDKLGADRWSAAIGGTDGRRFYVQMTETKTQAQELYVYDTALNTWTKEKPFDDLCIFGTNRNQMIAVCAKETDIPLFPDRERFNKAEADAAEPKREDYDQEWKYIAAHMAWTIKYYVAQYFGSCSVRTIKVYMSWSDPTTYPTCDDVPDSAVATLLNGIPFLDDIETYVATVSYWIISDDEVETRQLPGNLYSYVEGTFETQALTPEAGTELDRTWYAETGLLGLSNADAKRVREVSVRIRRRREDTLRISLQFDDEAQWNTAAVSTDVGFVTVRARLTPAKRCEAFRIRLEGTGECVLYGLDYMTEDGGNGVL